MKRRHSILLALLLVVAGLLALYATWTWRIQQRFATTLAGCDRVIVESWGMNWNERKTFLDIHEINGADKIASFISSIRIFGKRAPCKCMGNPRLRFFQGETQVVMLGLDHGDSLKGLDGSAAGYTLTGTSRDAVVQWFRDQGYAAIDQAMRDGMVHIGEPPNVNTQTGGR